MELEKTTNSGSWISGKEYRKGAIVSPKRYNYRDVGYYDLIMVEKILDS